MDWQEGPRMKNFTYRRNGESGFLVFFGGISCDRLEEFRQALLLSMHNSKRLIVDLSNVTWLDPNCLQPICKTLKSARRLNRQIVLLGQYGNVFRNAAMEAGCVFHAQCVMH